MTDLTSRATLIGGTDLHTLPQQAARLWPHLDEHARRLFAASEARDLGHGGVSLVSRAWGLWRVTIMKGRRELDEAPLAAGRVRCPGGGRPRSEGSDPDLLESRDALVEPTSRGDPESLWKGSSPPTAMPSSASSRTRSARLWPRNAP